MGVLLVVVVLVVVVIVVMLVRGVQTGRFGDIVRRGDLAVHGARSHGVSRVGDASGDSRDQAVERRDVPWWAVLVGR